MAKNPKNQPEPENPASLAKRCSIVSPVARLSASQAKGPFRFDLLPLAALRGPHIEAGADFGAHPSRFRQGSWWGLGWILRPVRGDLIREAWSDFHTAGGAQNCAELSAMVGGLIRARAEGYRRVVLRSDSQFATEILTLQVRPAANRVIKVTDYLRLLIPQSDALAVRWTPAGELKQVDKLSRTFMCGAHARLTNDACYYLFDTQGASRRRVRPTFPAIAPWHCWEGKFPWVFHGSTRALGDPHRLHSPVPGPRACREAPRFHTSCGSPLPSSSRSGGFSEALACSRPPPSRPSRARAVPSIAALPGARPPRDCRRASHWSSPTP